MPAADPLSLRWFAYKDEEGYWIESGDENWSPKETRPCLSLWTPRRKLWTDAIEKINERLQTKKKSVLRPKSVLITDPIYDYIYVPPPVAYSLTPHPVEDGHLFVQRLRYIKQNSAAYMVFPSLRSSRFEHSLGAMELARRISDSLFKSSSTDNIKEFSHKVRCEFAQGSRYADGSERDSPWLACFRQLSETREAEPDPSKDNSEAWDRKLDRWVISQTKALGLLTPRRVSELSQGAQHVVSKLAALHFFKLTACLVALLHDVGHLPFSHALEEPLQELLERNGGRIVSFPDSSKKIHERISLEIIRTAQHLFTSSAWRDAVLVSLLAEKDAKWQDPQRQWVVNSSVFATLHGMVSSEVDVDRLDFVARDGYESGAAVGSFDLPRILRSAVLYDKKLTSDDQPSPDKTVPLNKIAFGIAFRDHSLGQIEALLFERFKLYKTIAHHHKVRFFDTAVGLLFSKAEATERCFLGWAFVEEGKKPNEESLFVDLAKMGLRPFFIWDTGSKARYFNAKFLIQAQCSRGERRRQSIPIFFDDGFVIQQIRRIQSRDLSALRDAFLLRTPLSFSLWKRPAEFRPILRELKERVSKHIGQSKKVIGATPDQVQRFLIGLQSSDDGVRGMH